MVITLTSNNSNTIELLISERLNSELVFQALSSQFFLRLISANPQDTLEYFIESVVFNEETNSTLITLETSSPILTGQSILATYTPGDQPALVTLLEPQYQIEPFEAEVEIVEDSVSPSITSVDIVSPSIIRVSFNEIIDASATGPNPGILFNITSAGFSKSVSSSSFQTIGSKSTLEIMLNEPLADGGPVALSYTDPSSNNDAINIFQDISGNDVSSYYYEVNEFFQDFRSIPNTIGLDPILESAISSEGWYSLEGNSRFMSYFAKLLRGSVYNESEFAAPGLNVQTNSIRFWGLLNELGQGDSSLSGFESLSLTDEISLPLGGLFLSSGGSAYQNLNSKSYYSIDRGQSGDQQLTGFAQTAFEGAGLTYDASILQFTFIPAASTETLFIDVVFGSDEYYEFLDSPYVDIAAIWFEGQDTPKNFADFSGDGSKPLSIVTESTNDQRFVNNDGRLGPGQIPGAVSTVPYTPLPIEFDGITKKLTIGIPLSEVVPGPDGSYKINIGVADTGDHVLDSAIWVSNLYGVDLSVDGFFLNTVAEGEYIAPQGIPTFIEVLPGAQVTPGLEKDIIALPNDNTSPAVVTGSLDQLDGDKIAGFNNFSTLELNTQLLTDQIQISQGSAIIKIDENNDGFSPEDPEVRLEGDYFDIRQFAISADSGKTIIKYMGDVPLSPSPLLNTPISQPVPPAPAPVPPAPAPVPPAPAPVPPAPAPVPSTPVVTLGVVQATVTEDGETNLVYVFTRSGQTDAPLTVNYKVGGSAKPASDYSGITNLRGMKSVTFSPGAATTSITLDPTSDTTAEADETVSVTLASGKPYIVGTTAAVISTITNDDIIGTSTSNILIGTGINEFIDGRGQQDFLTGGVGPDRFGFRFGESRVTAPDRITDFEFEVDKIDLFSTSGRALPRPAALSRAADNSTATTLRDLVTAVFSDANGSSDGSQGLGANAAAIVLATNPAITGTYLIVNDGTPGFGNGTDLVIDITGPMGAPQALGIITLESMFA